MADPLEMAKLAVYLAADDSAYVVGADFLIDGGVTAISGRWRLNLVVESGDFNNMKENRNEKEITSIQERDHEGAGREETGTEGTHGCHRP